jgi:hypothetical protein
MCIPESYQEDFEECPGMFALEWPVDIEPEDGEELPPRPDFLYSF